MRIELIDAKTKEPKETLEVIFSPVLLPLEVLVSRL